MILVSLITSCVVAFAAYMATEAGIIPVPGLKYLPAPVAAPVMASVPALDGMTLEAATELLRGRGLTVLVRDKQHHATAPIDTVIGQEPLAGSMLPPQAPVAVTLSSGKANETTVPELVGQTLEDATRALETAELKVGTLSGPQTGLRTVEKSEPPPRSLVTPGSVVALTLVAADVEVPKLVGLGWPRAKKLIESSGFKVGTVRDRYDEYRDAWVVLGQTPEAGTRAAKGSAIDIVRAEDN
jgi:serine/threonine-protein kinase